jgi:ABC-2 type transport system permease protein
MSLWRLEWLRMVRTRRGLALVGVWAFFGLLGPLTARYLGEILETVGGDIAIEIPEAVPADGITQFMSNGLQIGLLAVVVVAAAALTLDANPEMSMFLRTRVDSGRRLITPRYIVVTAAAVVAFACGLALAAYETWALLGGLPAGRIVVGGLLFVVYLAFVVALVAGIGGWLTSVVMTAGISVGILLLLALSGLVDSIEKWFPSHLAGSLDALARGAEASDYLGAVGVTLVLIPVLIWVGLKGFERREL